MPVHGKVLGRLGAPHHHLPLGETRHVLLPVHAEAGAEGIDLRGGDVLRPRHVHLPVQGPVRTQLDDELGEVLEQKILLCSLLGPRDPLILAKKAFHLYDALNDLADISLLTHLDLSKYELF